MEKKAAWTGEIVGLLHVNNITQRQLADEMGVSDVWLSTLLNGKRGNADTESRMRSAIQTIIERNGT